LNNQRSRLQRRLAKLEEDLAARVSAPVPRCVEIVVDDRDQVARLDALPDDFSLNILPEKHGQGQSLTFDEYWDLVPRDVKLAVEASLANVARPA